MPTSDLVASQARSPIWRRARGPLLTTAVSMGLAVLAGLGLVIPNPGVPLLMTVLYAGYTGGLIAGTLSSLLTIAYVGVAYSLFGFVGELPGDPLVGVSVMIAAAPAVAVAGAAARRRIDAAARSTLESARELSRTLFASVQDGVMVSRAGDAAIRDVNPRLSELTGYGRDQLIGRVPPYPFWPPESAATIQQTLEQAFAGKIGEYDFEFLTRDGSRLAVIASRSPLRDGAGRIIGAVTTIKDVTERRAADEALHHSQQLLQHAQRMEAVGRLAGGVAHDFNNLLTAITGYTDLILSDLEDERIRPDLEEIRRTAERAAALTRQLLTFSRREVTKPSVLDLNRLIANLEPMLERLIGDDIRLETHFDPRLWSVRADPGQLEQVIVNLAVNARDAMAGVGLLTIETVNRDVGEIGDGRTAAQRYAVVDVIDTGHGMDAEIRSRLFEPFFTTKEQGKGTGLGLSTVYGIVTQAGGTIEVDSEPDAGARFRIVLPMVDSAALPDTPSPVAEAPSAGSETVLVAEDDPAVRALVSLVLRRLGYDILEAADASHAELLAERHAGPIHLLLTDVVMPGAHGPELARRLRSTRPDMRVLLMSGYTDDELVVDGMLGGADFLAKPFTPTELGLRVRAVLDAEVPSLPAV